MAILPKEDHPIDDREPGALVHDQGRQVAVHTSDRPLAGIGVLVDQRPMEFIL